jgi:guanylate kinase
MAKNFLFIISGPSGVGKTTVAKHLLDRYSNLVKSISTTTRNPRNNEIDGQDYYFITQDEHLNYVKNNLFLEYAQIFNNYYGTPKRVVENAMHEDKNVIFDIDIQGFQQIKNSDVFEVVSIFLIPDSIDTLRNRIISRGNLDDIDLRVQKAKLEISFSHEYDYIIINRDLYDTCENIEAIYRSECLKREKMFTMNFIENVLMKE